MGRLFQWIRSATRSRRAASAAVHAPRRHLAFERCEPRIALSANDGNVFVFTELLPESLHLEFSSWLARRDDGGSITMSFTADDFAFNRSVIFEGSALDTIAVGDSTNFAVQSEALSTLVKSGSPAVTLTAAAPQFGNELRSWTPLDDFQFDQTTSDYGLTLTEPESSSPSLNSDLSVIPTPTPSEQPGVGGGNEGGQIALTPFVAPTGLTLSDGQASSSIARAKPATDELRDAAPSDGRETNRPEGLRGRAIVYEVAEANTPDQSAEDDQYQEQEFAAREAIRLATFNDLAPGDARDETSRPHLPTEAAIIVANADRADGEQLNLIDNDPLESFGMAAELSFNGAPGELMSPLSLNGDEGIAAQDVVFGELGADAPSAIDADSLKSAYSGRDRRMLGVGVAVALSFVPLRRAWRRHGEQVVAPRR